MCNNIKINNMAIPSIAMIPSGYKASKLYSVLPTDGSGDLDVVRATTATRVNSDGLIENVLPNVPRLDYTNGGCPSLLVEPQRTNLLLRSEEFDNVYWTKTRNSVTPNDIIAPNGNLTADKVIENTDTGSHFLAATPTTITAGSILTHSIFFKRITGSADRFLRISMLDNTFLNGARALFDVQNGTIALAPISVGLGSNVSSNIEDYGNGWYRASLTCKLDDVSTTLRLENYLQLTGVTYSASYTGDGTSGIYIWGAQLEQASNASSYIPTVASTVTRNADVISKTGISDLIGQTEGTLFVEVDLKNAITGTTRRFMAIGDGTSNNRIGIGLDTANRIEGFVVASGIAQAIIQSATATNQPYKIALAYKSNDIILYINGIQIGSDVSATIPAVSNFYLIHEFISSLPADNGITQALLYKTRLSNAELATLTTL